MKLLVAISGVILLCSFFQGSSATGYTTCTRDYTKIGCLSTNEKTAQREDMTRLVNDRDGEGHELDWNKMEESVHSLACRCSKIARDGGYAYFGIRFWAECWGGKNQAALDKVIKDGEHTSNQCSSHKFGACDDSANTECVGKADAEYIYVLNAENKAPEIEKIDGGFSEWSDWTPCTKSCGQGEKIRERTCSNPEPVGAGAPCVGSTTEAATCLVKECPVQAIWPQDFKWSPAGIPAGYKCVQINEPADKDTWGDNFLCWKDVRLDPGFKWSSDGTIAGMRCTQISEGSEPLSNGWNNNYLCVPTTSPFHFSWSSAGKIAGSQCLQWLEAADPNTWKDNYLCSGATVNCAWNAWGAYGTCSKTCGQGSQTRSRTNTPAQYGGVACSGSTTSSKSCQVRSCPAIGGYWNTYTGWSDMNGDGSSRYLDRQTLSCGSSAQKLLTSFHMERSGNRIRYKQKCATLSSATASKQVKYTGTNDDGGGKLKYLDRHSMDCGTKAFIGGFKLERPSGKKIRYRFNCMKLTGIWTSKSSCYDKSTKSTDDGDGKNCFYLDRQTASCNTGYAFSKIHLVQHGNNIRYNYRCCKVQ